MEKTFSLSDLSKLDGSNATLSNSASKNNTDIVESACKMLIEQVLKSCPNVNLSSITIKTTAVPTGSGDAKSNDSPATTTTATVQLKPSPAIVLNSPNTVNFANKRTNSISTSTSPSSQSVSSSISSASIEDAIEHGLAHHHHHHQHPLISLNQLNTYLNSKGKNKKKEHIAQYNNGLNSPTSPAPPMPFSSSNENNNNNSDSLNQNSKLCISTAVTNPANASYESKGLKRKLDKSPLAATPSASMSKTLSNMNNSDEETYDYDEYNENSFSSDSLNDSLYSSQNRANSSCGMAGQIRPAPTLATGRKSKDTELPPDEARKRQDRRERNKEAAARCRRKREDLTTTLTKVCLFSDLCMGGMM